MSTQPSLCNLPNELAIRIFNRVGFRSIQNLRRVCRGLRICIDDIKPEANLSDVIIDVTDCKIRFIYGSKIHNLDVEESEKIWLDTVEYQKTVESGRSIVRSRGSEKIVNGDFMELASRDFQLFLKFQKQSIESISFVNRAENSNHFLQFLENLKRFLAFENRLLKVDVFNINAIDQKSVITALSMIEPGSIYWITLNNLNRVIQPKEFPEILEMEHWKKAKSFTSTFRITDVSVHNFRHFSRFEVMFQSISVEDLLDLKKIFQNSSEADMFEIRYESFEDSEQIFEKMGPAVMMSFDEFEWFFRMSITADYVLLIQLKDPFKSIIFLREAVDDVPEHAVIQN